MPTHTLNDLALPDLYAALRHRGVLNLLNLARDEDLGTQRRDLASAALPPTADAFTLRARQPGLLAGLAALPDLITAYDARATFIPHKADADHFAQGDPIATLTGDPAHLLAIERPLLNLLSRLSGVATLTARFVAAIEGTNAHILDTRKTTPGLRALEKYAVRCGGGRSHRLGLDDAAMFKDNHLAAVPLEDLPRVLADAAARAKDAGAAFVEVEVDTLDQLDRLLRVEPGLIDYALLDNMSAESMRTAVHRRDERQPDLTLEASGNVTLKTVRTIADTGVDRISVGALTHSAPPIDLALDAHENT